MGGFHSIQSGETLSKIAKQYGVTVKQLQEANGIKNANLIFAGDKLKLPSVETDEGFEISGLTVERNTENAQPASSVIENNQEETVDMATETPAGGSDGEVKITEQSVQNNNTATEVKQEKVEPQQNKAPEVKAEENDATKIQQDNKEPASVENTDNRFQIAANLKFPVQISDALTPEKVSEELYQKWIDGGSPKEGYGPIPALPGEIKEGDWSEYFANENVEMVCRDDSGKTKNISGKMEPLHDTWDKNPDAFTITDSSSGSDHEYLYRKIGLNDKGQPVYKCISMNGNPIETDNQYTMEWNDGIPELVQHSDQDNHSIGLRVGEKKSEPYNAQGQEPYNAQGQKLYYTDLPERYRTGAGDDTKEKEISKPSVGENGNAQQAPEKKEVEIYLNRQPRSKGPQPTFGETKREIVTKCEKQRPLSKTEQEQLNACKNMQEVYAYLKSIGINLRLAV